MEFILGALVFFLGVIVGATLTKVNHSNNETD